MGELVRGSGESKSVRVSYVSKGFGLALTLDDGEQHDELSSDGVLRVGEACITLEIPAPDGKGSVLAWDPAEVNWDSMVA